LRFWQRNFLKAFELFPSFEGITLDIPRDKLLALVQAYVAQAMPIVREQERLIDQIRGEAVDSPFIQRALEAVAKTSGAVVAQEALVRELRRGENGSSSGPENEGSGR
jgi:hypothetical protein